MDVIDRLRRISRLDQKRHIRLDGWGRDVAECQLAKPRNQVLLHDVLMILLPHGPLEHVVPVGVALEVLEEAGAVDVAGRAEQEARDVVAAYDFAGLRLGGVAPPSNTPGISVVAPLPAGCLARLGATPDFHHGLLARSIPPQRVCVESRAASSGVES